MGRRALVVGRGAGRALVLARPGLGIGAVLLLMVISSFAAVLRPAEAVVPGEDFAVSDGGADKTSPSVSGPLVVWEDKRHGNSDVYARRLSPAGGPEFPVTAHPADQRRPAVSGEFVAWEDDRGGDWDIYGKDLASGPEAPEVPIAVAPGDQRKPKISGKKVVWQDGRKGTATGFDLDVYYKDLERDGPESSGHEIPAPAGNQTSPDISGDTVVWEDDRTGRMNIYGKNLASQAGAFPIGGGAAWQDQPAVSGNIVVWRQDNGNNYDIFGRDLMAKDLATGEVFQVTSDVSDQWSPDISGTVVVWSDGRNGNSDAYGKDLATGREFRVTADASPQDSPAIDGETVVWEDQRIGETAYGIWDIRGSTLDAAPAAPTVLEAKATAGGVNLSWNLNTTDADLDGYNVYRADAEDGPYAKLNAAPLPAATTAGYFDETSLPEPGSSFYYKVRAQDATGSESAAAEARITTPVVPPPSTTPEGPVAQPTVQPPPVPAAPAPTPPQVVISNPNPVVPVRKTIRITIRKLGAHARATVTVFRNGKVVARRTVAANSGFAFNPSVAGRYTVKASVPNASHSKTFRAR